MKKRNHFIRLFHTNKFLFVIVLLFVILNLAANFFFKAEHTPIFRWDMYSQKIAPQRTYSFLEVRYNDGKALSFQQTWQEPKKLFFTNTLNHFIAMRRNNSIDPLKNYIDHWNHRHPFFQKLLPGLKFYNDTAELEKFPAWYKKFLAQHVGNPVYRIDVYEIRVAYEKNGEVKKLSSNLIYKLL